MIRLFAGLSLPETVTGPLTALQGGIPGARWIEARNLHISLRFMGEVEEGLAQDIHDTLSTLEAPAFQVSVAGFGIFGRDRPKHLWAGVEREPALSHLQSKIESAMVRLGLPHESRKYTPHITLARLKDTPPSRISEFMAQRSPFRAEPFAVESFILYRSYLGRSGAEYEALAEYGLRPGA